jgi:hypothetical protein
MNKTAKLGIHVVHNGFIYKLVKRTDIFAIYEQFIGSVPTGLWEVIKIKLRNARTEPRRWARQQGYHFIAEDYPEWKETFPNDEDFGKRSWIFTSLKKAEQKFNQLDMDSKS